MIILLLIYIALVALFASEEARADAIDIRNGKPIRHADAWKERACVAAFGAAIISAMHLFWVWGLGVFLWHFAGLCVVAVGAFTPVFRWHLNRLRGMDARYVSPSSLYDWFFIWCAMPAPKEGGKMWHLFSHDTIGGARMKHAELYSSNLDFWTRIHRAGRLAYITEGLALLIGCAITLELWK